MSQTRPLDGIRVLDFGAFVAGPYCGTILAALGADVVKVESPRGGDPFRRGEGAKNAYFNQMNAGKKSLAVDLKRPEGIALIKALLPGFDVLIENTRPGKMAALGLGPDVARAINPDLVYSSVSGFGDGGPWRDRAAYDTIGLSMSGFLSIMSDKDNTRLAGTCIGDLTTALVSVIGIVTGLVGRFKGTGQGGSEVKTSLLEAMTTITVDAMTQYFETGETPHRESRHPAAQSFALKTSDGQAITLHMSSSPKFFKGMLSAIERTDLLEDPRFATYDDRRAHYFELRPVVEAAFLRHDRDEWERRLIANDVPYAPVVTPDELTEHEQMQWLDMYEPPRDDGLRLLRAPMRFDGARPANHVGAPEVGQNSREVALEVLPEAEVEALIEAGVIAQAPSA